MSGVTHKITQAGPDIRVTTWSKDGSSSKTCRTMAEVEAFIATVKARLKP